MKTAIIFYSRDGTTRKLAEHLKKRLKCDIEELIDKKERKGPINYIKSGRDALKELKTELEKTKLDLAKYDLIVLGSPNWANNMAPAIRTYIEDHKQDLKKIACISTRGGSSPGKVNEKMAKLAGKKPIATLDLTTKEVWKDDFGEKADSFINDLK